MDAFSSLSASLASLAARAAARLFHVPSPLGGRTALSFDGKRLLVPARWAEEGEELELLAPGGASAKATVLGFDPERGLAVLELAEALAASAWEAGAGLPAIGSLVLVAAYPSPQGPEIRLDAVRFSGGEDPYIQTDGAPFPGFAGAAIVDAEGKLAGFVVSDRPGNRGWAIPASRASELVSAIVERGFPSRAWLGLSTVPIEAPSGSEAILGGRESALLVAGLEGEGPAAKAGLLVGDILVTIGGAPVGDPEELADALAAARPGAPLALVVLRGGAKVELSALPEAQGPRDSARGRGPWKRGRGWGPWGHGRGWGPWGGERSCCGPEN